jgi:hypothetical protein
MEGADFKGIKASTAEQYSGEGALASRLCQNCFPCWLLFRFGFLAHTRYCGLLKVQMNTDLMTASRSFWLVGQPDVERVKISKVSRC